MAVTGAREIPSADAESPTVESTDWVEVGRLARPHGLRGHLLVALWGDDLSNLKAAPRVRLRGAAGERESRVLELRPARADRNGGVRARIVFEGIDSRTDAERWAGASLSIPETALESLPEGEYYWRDLIGLRCGTVDGVDLGVIEEIWPTGSNDVLVVRKGEDTVLVPALYDVIARVDLAAREVEIDPPRGLLESAS